MKEKPYSSLEKTKGLLNYIAQYNCSQAKVKELLNECDVYTFNTVMLVMMIGSEYRLINRRKPVKHPDAVLLDWCKHFGFTTNIVKANELEYFFSKSYRENISRALLVLGAKEGSESRGIY